MKKRIFFAGCAAALLLAGCMTSQRPSTLGNGQIDLPVDISVTWHDAAGNGFTLVEGVVKDVTYRSLKTGLIYQVTDTDGFGVTAPDGTTVNLKLKPAAPISL